MIGRFTLVVALALMPACSRAAPDQRTSIKVNANANVAVRTGNVESEPPELLCSRLTEIKAVTFRGERGVDKTFDAFLDAGDAVVPCLIERVMDSSKIKKPIQTPGYAGIEFRTGDLAFFVLLFMKQVTADQFLPDGPKRDYETEGSYTYYKFVQTRAGRKKVHDNLLSWYERTRTK